MTEARTIPLTVIGGYLGAGKTTLLNLLLHTTAGRRLAVLVNDFGRVNIDASLIARHDGDTISLTNGCICCSLASGFHTVLAGLRERDTPPEHVIVEASGVADPFKIGQYGHLPGFRLDAIVVLVDAETIRARAQDKYVGTTVMRQLRGADLLVLTKLDLVDDEQAATVRAWLRAAAPGARVIDSAFGALPWPVVHGFAAPPTGDLERRLEPGPESEHTLDYDTWTVARANPIAGATIRSLAAALPDGVLRGKGIVWTVEAPENRTVFQLVGKRWSLKRGEPWGEQTPRTELVLIGVPRSIDGDRLHRILNGAAATEETVAQPDRTGFLG